MISRCALCLSHVLIYNRFSLLFKLTLLLLHDDITFCATIDLKSHGYVIFPTLWNEFNVSGLHGCCQVLHCNHTLVSVSIKYLVIRGNTNIKIFMFYLRITKVSRQIQYESNKITGNTQILYKLFSTETDIN